MHSDLPEAKRQLLSRRHALQLRIPAQKSAEREAEGNVPSSPEDAASAQQMVLRGAAVTLAEEREFDEIEAALRRIDAGTYGTCETCARAISPNRLRAVPQARLCMECSADRRGERR